MDLDEEARVKVVNVVIPHRQDQRSHHICQERGDLWSSVAAVDRLAALCVSDGAGRVLESALGHQHEQCLGLANEAE